MKILLYAEPTLLFSVDPLMIHVHFYRWLAKELLYHHDIEIKTIVSELAVKQNEKNHLLDILHPISFKTQYLQQLFPQAHSVREMFLKVFNEAFSKRQHSLFQRIIKQLLPTHWEPDIVVTFPIHNGLLKHVFPNALHFVEENAIFSRPPFCRTLRFDPIHYLNGFLNKYENEIRNFKISPEQKQKLELFKSQLRQLIDKHNPLKKELQTLKKKFHHLVLCPIPTDNSYKETYYDDQYLYLLHLLRKIPTDIGLIITFHDSVSSQLNATVIRQLQKIYPNLIWHPVSDNSFISQSLMYFNYVDAIINMHTMTGTQALLWDVKVISLDKRYSKWFCDKQDLDNLNEFLTQPRADKSSLLYWYLTHFTVFEQNCNTPGWYYNFFKTKLAAFRAHGITFDLYQPQNDFDTLSTYILDYVKDYYRPWSAGKRVLIQVWLDNQKRIHSLVKIWKKILQYF